MQFWEDSTSSIYLFLDEADGVLIWLNQCENIIAHSYQWKIVPVSHFCSQSVWNRLLSFESIDFIHISNTVVVIHSPSCVWPFATPWSAAHQDSLSLTISQSFCPSESEVVQSPSPVRPLCNPMDCSLPGSSVHRIFQVRILEWAAISLSRGSPQPRDQTWVSCFTDRCFTIWATREAFAQVHVYCNCDAVQPSHPLTVSFLLPLIFPSIRDFSNESSVCIHWQKYWGFSFSISPSSEYSGLISFKTDWFNLLAVQGTFRSLLQLKKASNFWPSAFFTVQFSQPYRTTGNSIALTIWTFVGRIMSPFQHTA